MLEAVSVALHAVSLVPVHPQDNALVVGAGMIGLLILQALQAAGCSHVYVSDVDQTRLELSRKILGQQPHCLPDPD